MHMGVSEIRSFDYQNQLQPDNGRMVHVSVLSCLQIGTVTAVGVILLAMPVFFFIP